VYCDNLLPSVSRERYEKVFREFEAWCNRKKVKQITEEVVLVYIGTWWNSTSVAEGYVENSIQNKINIAKKIHNQEENTRGIFIFGGGNKRLRNVTKMYCQRQISHKRRKKECLGKFKFSLN
jgi:hypothetical protein